MKTKFLLGLFALFFVGAMNAQQQTKCTVKTDCVTKTFDEQVSAGSVEGVVTVTNAAGEVLDTFECADSGVSVSCVASSGDIPTGDSDLCDRIRSPRIRALLGCDD